MKQRSILLTMLLLMVGVSMQAQSVSDKQMDERFNDNKLPYGWYTEGWEVDSTGVAQKKSSSFDMEHFDISKLMGDDDSYNYLMTPPLSVKSGEVLSFSAKKGEGGNSGLGSFMGDNDTTFVVERAIYGEHRWKKVADFTTQLDSVYKTFTISNTEPGEYRFRFRAGGDVMIDSVAGFHIDTNAPDIYPAYQDKNIQPVDLGLCDKDTVVTFCIINTGTGTLGVSLSLDGEPSFTIDQSHVSVAAADTAKVKLTHTLAQAHEGRNSTMLSFKSGERVEEIILPIDAVKTQEDVYVQDFNTSEMPIGWFADGWEMKENTASVSKTPEDMGPIVSSNESFFLMTPPLTVKDEKEVLLFSVKLPSGGSGGFDMSSMMGGGDEGSKLAIEKSVYGSNKWEKIKDFTHVLDTVYTTQWISNIEPGDYRFRFVATDSLVIDSVAGFQFIEDAPDMYVKVDTVAIRDFDFGLLAADTVKTYTIINTGTGDFNVNVFPSDPRYISLDKNSVSLNAGQSEAVNATVRDNEEAQGEVSAAIIFQPEVQLENQDLSIQMSGIHAYIIPKDSWKESFEPEYVVEDDTYPCRFPEGWTSTGWEIVQSSGDMMSMFMGDDGGEKPYVASSSSNEYELITPRLQAKQGQVLKFNAQAGGGMAMRMSMFGADMGAPQYLSVYYKRDNDKDWTLYNMYFTSGDAFFKAPYSGYYQLKFVGGGSSVDEFIGFSLPKDSVILKDDYSRVSTLLSEQEGKIWNVVFERKLSANAYGNGTFDPVAATICLPYDFNIDEYYAPGTAKIYQMAYVDTYYNQFIFREMPDNMIQAGHPYMIIVNKGDVNFNAIGARLTNVTDGNVPVYDYEEWRLNDSYSQLGEWHGIFESRWAKGTEYSMNDDGVWEMIMEGGSMTPFRSYLLTSEDLGEYWFKQIPDVSDFFANRARSFDTRFYNQDENGNDEVVDIPNLLYIGDITGGADGATGIVPTIRTIDRDGTENYFDLQGHRLNSKPNKGIYIENGKKYAK